MPDSAGLEGLRTRQDDPLHSEPEGTEREIIEQAQRELLSEDLLSYRLEFRSRPYEAHIQFGTYCNQSCIMCWDGENPPAIRMPGALLDKVRRQLGPTLSLMTPYSGSEPLAAHWQAAQEMAEDYDIRIALTTNTELLDTRRFTAIAPHLQTLMLSVDSHDPDVLGRIRGSRHPDRILANLETSARQARELGLECLAQIVFLTENARDLPETIADFARRGVESISIIPLIDVNGHSRSLDPRAVWPSDEVQAIRRRCFEAASRAAVRLVWHVDEFECVDPRSRAIEPHPEKRRQEVWQYELQRTLPGYCPFVMSSVRVDVRGDVAPCCYDVTGELSFGNLGRSDFEDLWNGPTARDLRRAMQTGDLPSLCEGCRFVGSPPPAIESLPFTIAFEKRLSGYRKLSSFVEAPIHLSRTPEPPEVRWRHPSPPIREYVVLIALGGEGTSSSQPEPAHETLELRVPCPASAREGEIFRFEVPEEIWERLRVNLGYWWTVYALPIDPELAPIRSSDIRCVIRHRSRPRVSGSRLRYPKGSQPSPDE